VWGTGRTGSRWVPIAQTLSRSRTLNSRARICRLNLTHQQQCSMQRTRHRSRIPNHRGIPSAERFSDKWPVRSRIFGFRSMSVRAETLTSIATPNSLSGMSNHPVRVRLHNCAVAGRLHPASQQLTSLHAAYSRYCETRKHENETET
jgi:hypothetical protein